MTINEYSTLMGYEETCEMAEYETANFIYMMAGDMDKRKFCEEYKEVGCSPLILELAESANRYEKAYREKQEQEKKIANAILRASDDMREAELHDIADRMDRIADTIIGRKDIIKWKLEHFSKLSDTDIEYIKINLR